MQQNVTAADAMTIPRVQLRPPALSLAVIAKRHAGRDEAIVAAYATGALDCLDYRKAIAVPGARLGRK